jgi:hypothetical protein
MKYRARIREIIFYEVVVEATSYKDCFAVIQQYLCNLHGLPLSDQVGLRFEIESITKGSQYDNPTIKRKPFRRKRSPRSEPEGMEI